MLLKSINAWSVPAQVGFADMFADLKKAGFDCVELNLDAPGAGAHALSVETTDEELLQIKKLSEAAGLPICSISSSQWGKSALAGGTVPTRFLLEKQLHCAQMLGADGILIVPGGIGPDCSIRQAYINAKNELLACRDLIEGQSVKVGVENVWNNFFISPFDMVRFIDELNIKNLGAYFDVGNVEIFSDPEYWIELLGSRIVKIHVKDFRRAGGNAGAFVNLLEGSIRWAKVVKALKEAGYNGPLTAELSAMPETPDYLYRITADALETIIAMA